MQLRLALGTIALSGILACILGVVFFIYRSQLALGQAADSVTDMFTAGALSYSMWLARRPADAGHPRGHHRAEPIAALVAAVLAGVLAAEVIQSAASALFFGQSARMGWALALAFAIKVGAKAGVVLFATQVLRRAPSPALEALRVDARNDVLVGLVALAGFTAARFGWPGWDAVLAIPIAVWIAASGVALARESIQLLMGAAAPEDRCEALQRLVEATPGVRSTHGWVVRHDGTGLDVAVDVVVDAALSVRAAHDIAEAVEARLLAEADVMEARVHVDVD